MKKGRKGHERRKLLSGLTISVLCVVLTSLTLFAFSKKKNAVHDFHTSLTEANFNAESKSLEITIRVFTDDFERALTELNDGKSVKINPTDTKIDPLILRYLRKHFAFVSPDKQVMPYDYLGKEIELDAIWLYVEVPNAGNFKGYSIFNNILVEQFDDQTNLLNLIYPDKKKSFIFDVKTKVVPYPF